MSDLNRIRDENFINVSKSPIYSYFNKTWNFMRIRNKNNYIWIKTELEITELFLNKNKKLKEWFVLVSAKPYKPPKLICLWSSQFCLWKLKLLPLKISPLERSGDNTWVLPKQQELKLLGSACLQLVEALSMKSSLGKLAGPLWYKSDWTAFDSHQGSGSVAGSKEGISGRFRTWSSSRYSKMCGSSFATE